MVTRCLVCFKVRMPRKAKEPPRAVFKHRKVALSQWEKPKVGLNPEWIAELNDLEERMKNFIVLDINRVKKVCDSSGELDRVCKVVGVKVALGDIGEDLDYSLHDILVAEEKVERKISYMPRLAKYDDKSSTSSDVENEEVTKSLYESVIFRASSRKAHVSPYKVPLSEESSEVSYSSSQSTPAQSLTTKESIETTKSITEDLYVNPAASQNTQMLEPLEDARSPYQRFFLRSPHEIRHHVERLRKKKFYSASEKCIEEFIKFLDENQVRSEKVTFETVNNLFKLEMDKPVEQAFMLDPIELPAVPKEVSDLYNDPHSSTRAALHKQIMWDMFYEEGKERKIQFGKALDRQRKLWKKDTRNRWFTPSEIDWDLVTGQDFWKEFLHTEILEGFGTWLLDNPNYNRPEYLERIGFFDYLENKIKKESDTVKVPVQHEKQLTDLMESLIHPLSLDKDDIKLQELPRYQELKEAALHRHLSLEGIQEFN